MRVAMSNLNDQSEVCFDHTSPSHLVAVLNACGQLNLLLHSQQRRAADLLKVNLNARLRIVNHAPTSPQTASEATAGFDSYLPSSYYTSEFRTTRLSGAG